MLITRIDRNILINILGFVWDIDPLEGDLKKHLLNSKLDQNLLQLDDYELVEESGVDEFLESRREGNQDSCRFALLVRRI